jgi:hypothetical protein
MGCLVMRKVLIIVAVATGMVVLFMAACEDSTEPLPYPFSQLLPSCEEWFGLKPDSEYYAEGNAVAPGYSDLGVVMVASRTCESGEKAETSFPGAREPYEVVLPKQYLGMEVSLYKSEDDAVAYMDAVRESTLKPGFDEIDPELPGVDEEVGYVADNEYTSDPFPGKLSEVAFRRGRYVAVMHAVQRDSDYPHDFSELASYIAARRAAEEWPHLIGTSDQ